MKPIIQEALKAIAKHILTVPEKQWNMFHWQQNSAECGTIGCAIGHSQHLPEVKALGLKFGESNPVSKFPKYGLMADMHAVAAAFELPLEVANYMFGSHQVAYAQAESKQRPDHELTQQRVHDRIMEVVNGDKYAPQ
jgi:hypothetical protein